ncbi:MAG: Ig-like domain repeat protein [Polaromonas sp.]|nr:Ig-like domain repeat protein [Polaromonas sp.]
MLPAWAAPTISTTTTLASSVNPVVVGSATTLTATVTGSNPAGSVTFKNGSAVLGTATLSGTGDSQVVSFEATITTAGAKNLTAAYGGDALNIKSTSAVLAQTVSKASATSSVVSSAAASAAGQAVTFTATVTGYSPTGNVAFKDGTSTKGTVALSGTGDTRTAVFTTSTLAAGSRSITAVYAGNTSNSAATSDAIIQTVTKASPTAALASSVNPSAAGQAVTFTATVTGNSPTGNVAFKDGTATKGTVALSGEGDTRTATFTTSALVAGSRSITAVYAGDILNSPVTTAPVIQVVDKVAATAALASSVNPTAAGQAVTFTATVTGLNPTGNVSFKDGTSTKGTVALSGTGDTRTAVFTTSTLPAGDRSITAVYAGNAQNTTATSEPLIQTVGPKTVAVTTLTSSLNPAAVGAAVTFSASVTGSAPTGTVTFREGTVILGTATLSGTGDTRTAAFTTSTLTAGNHSIRATYGGDAANTSDASNTLVQSITAPVAAPTTTTVASSANPAAPGQSVTLTATVTGSNPSGTVTFMDGATTLGTGTVNGGAATLSTSSLAVGSHSITAVYGGDTNNAASTSAALAQVVSQGATTTTVTSSANPAVPGQAITLTANVTGNNPSGTVTFMDGATTLGTGSINSGTASFSTNTLAAGSHSITAVYSGDANNAGSTSAALAQQVTLPTSTTTVSSSANPAAQGQALTLTATVIGSNPGGTVTFRDGAVTLGTGTLNAGTASLSINTLAAGSHSITAVYGGDANNASSTSSALVQTIGLAATSTALSVNPNPASLGQSVTLSATVAATGGGASPTGTVTFKNGGTTLGTAVLNAGAATFSTSSLGSGSHSLSADYAGDAANQASSSAPVVFAINAGAMVWQYGYDAMGRPTTVLDPNGLTTYTYYDSLGRPIQTQQPPNTGSALPTTTSFAYNGRDDLTKVTDPRALETTYTPNGLGDVTAQNSPDTGASLYTYDANGNVLTSTDARGKLTRYTYDNLDRLTRIQYPTGPDTLLEYDGGSTPTPAATGELTKITDASGQASYTYDALGRKTSKTQIVNGKTFTVGYSWGDSGSALDKLTAITYPSGSRVNYSYDAQGAVNAISVNPVNANGAGQSGTALPLLSAITRNAENKLTGWAWASTKLQAISYDSVGQITGYNLGDQTGTGLAAGVRRTVLRDSAGRITAYIHTRNGASVPGMDQTFAYDNLNRLVSATLGASSIQYSYDATGNRTAKAISGTSYANAIAPTSNKLTQTQDVLGTATIVHDAAGNITNDGTNTFSYSDRGRLATTANAGGTATYSHNALELRVSKSGPTALIPTGAAYYIYDEEGKLLGEYDANGTPISETIYLGSPVGVMKQTGTAASSNIAVSLYNVSTDQIGAPRVITRSTDEAIVWRWDTAEAFGATAPDQNPSNLGTFTFNQRFPGQVFDAESGLLQNWNREYNPRIGRYMQSDPIGLAGGINTFAYVGGNPLSYSDPTGLQAIPVPPLPIPGVPNPTVDAQRDLADRLSRALNQEREQREKTYQTYTRYNPLTGDCYSGRTSGYDDPLTNLKNRAAGQPLLNAEGFNPPVLDRSSSNPDAIRGREQQVIDVNGGARSTGGTSRNMINGISPLNFQRQNYLNTATSQFGTPVPAGRCLCQ